MQTCRLRLERRTASSSQGHYSIASSREGCRRGSGTGTMATPQCVRMY